MKIIHGFPTGFPVDSAQVSLEGGPRVSGAEEGREPR